MSNIIISLGAEKKQLISLNKQEAKNYIDTVKLPAIILTDEEKSYKEDSDFKYLSYHLLSNVQSPVLILIERKGTSIAHSLNATLSRLSKGLLIVDMPDNKEQCLELFEILSKSTNKNIQVLLNISDIAFLESNSIKLHTGWRLFNSITKNEYDLLTETIGELDANGIAICAALRDEYILTYKNWCKDQKRKPEQIILELPFYYSRSLISIKDEVFNELIEKIIEKIKVFGIEYSASEIKEMYL